MDHAAGQLRAAIVGFALAQSMGSALQATSPAPVADPIAMIEKLGELFQNGILTQAEFDAKKAERLQQIR